VTKVAHLAGCQKAHVLVHILLQAIVPVALKAQRNQVPVVYLAAPAACVFHQAHTHAVYVQFQHQKAVNQAVYHVAVFLLQLKALALPAALQPVL